MILSRLPVAILPPKRTRCPRVYSIAGTCRAISSSTSTPSSYSRSDFSGQGFSSFYEPDQPTKGPLGSTSNVGGNSITPKALRQHLDQFVVGQDRAKVVLSVAVHEHYLRIQELQRQRDETARLEEKAQRRTLAFRHAVEDEFPGQQPTVATIELYNHGEPPSHSEASYLPRPSAPREAELAWDANEHQLQIEKSNVLVLGPTGVGKTLMCKTLAKILSIPISMSDCTTFTQAGYIGDDVEQCVARLFSASNYDIEATEQGIIVLDEIDKIAGAKIAYGKDVGGEGVQQALLKIIEGTTVQVQAKAERSAGRPGASGRGNPLDGSQGAPVGGKGEIFNIRTDNILFICTGAFSGLHKIVLDRKATGSMGFIASIQTSHAHAAADGVMLTGAEARRFKKDSPFFVSAEEALDPLEGRQAEEEQRVNVLDHVQPVDLQKYGMIPELIGRVPTICAVSALDEEALVRVLTEPRDSLVRQEEHKSSLRNMELRFTSGALREIAHKAKKMGTGARGLRHVVDHLLLQAKYETPGTSVKHILVTRDVALLKRAPLYFQRGQSAAFQARLMQEEEAWEAKDGFEEDRKAGAAGC